MPKREVTTSMALAEILNRLKMAAEGAYDVWADVDAAEGASQAFEQAADIVREEFKKVTTF